MAKVLSYIARRYMSKTAVKGSPAASEEHGGSAKFWKNLSLFVGLPAVALASLNCYLAEEEHERPEFIKYDYLRIRTKRFPWGDGNHGFFHNPHMNALPDGYEDDH